jgi:hypothetical protein
VGGFEHPHDTPPQPFRPSPTFVDSSLEGVQEVVISKQVVEGTAPPLYVYADRSGLTGDASA